MKLPLTHTRAVVLVNALKGEINLLRECNPNLVEKATAAAENMLAEICKEYNLNPKIDPSTGAYS
jgi:hypothetical protein